MDSAYFEESDSAGYIYKRILIGFIYNEIILRLNCKVINLLTQQINFQYLGSTSKILIQFWVNSAQCSFSFHRYSQTPGIHIHMHPATQAYIGFPSHKLL